MTMIPHGVDDLGFPKPGNPPWQENNVTHNDRPRNLSGSNKGFLWSIRKCGCHDEALHSQLPDAPTAWSMSCARSMFQVDEDRVPKMMGKGTTNARENLILYELGAIWRKTSRLYLQQEHFKTAKQGRHCRVT